MDEILTFDEIAQVKVSPTLQRVGDKVGYVLEVKTPNGNRAWLAGAAQWTKNIFMSLHINEDDVTLAFLIIDILNRDGLTAKLPI